MSHFAEFDSVVVNDDFEHAVVDLLSDPPRRGGVRPRPRRSCSRCIAELLGLKAPSRADRGLPSNRRKSGPKGPFFQ